MFRKWRVGSVVELAGRKGYPRVNGVWNRVMSNVLFLFSFGSFCGDSNTGFRGSDDLGIGEARGSSGAS